MYAHQVIEDISKTKYSNISKEMGVKQGTILVDIKSSVKFHLENVGEIVDLLKDKVRGDYLFSEAQYMKSPYKKVWIDFASNNNQSELNKVGLLISAIGDGCLEIAYFYIMKGISLWAMWPILYTFDPLNIDKGIKYKALIDDKIVSQFGADLSGIMQGDAEIVGIVEFFFMLLNCKNITTEDNRPSVALNKSRRKKGKQELFTYKTLKLLLPRNKEKHELINEPTGDHNRIHFCRGHFKEYTAESPLFGRITGLWWWQAHVRGKNNDGIIMKDYEVMANV